MRSVDFTLIVILLVGLWLRWGLNGTWRLGPDEALYSTWARRVASGVDVWLANTSGVDKPPLFIYAIAGAMSIYGYTEFATRFPGIVAGTVSVILTYLLADRLYGKTEIAHLAALLMALSPFAILYAPTAYADSVMVMWLLLAAVLACYGRWGPAGGAAALATLTKQEAPLFVPLIVMLGYGRQMALGPQTMRRPLTDLIRPLLFMPVVAVVLTLAVEVVWESHRPGQPSPFSLGLANYGGIRPVTPPDVLPRLTAWWQQALQYTFASPLLNLLLIVGGVGLPALNHAEHRHADRLLIVAIGYVVLARTLVSFQLWHRYMLVIVPLLCILLARVIDWGLTVALRRGLTGLPARRPWRRLLPLFLAAMLMLAPVSDALAGRIPVGADHGLYWGIEQTAQFIRDNVPPGSVIYHRSLGWQFGYYLYGAHLDFWWYPSLAWLAQTAASRAEHSQYIVVPSWESVAPIAGAMATEGMQLLPVHVARRPDGSVSFQTYRIAPAEDKHP